MSRGGLVAAPYAHGGGSVGRTMVLVMAALLPATLFGLWRFGWPAVNLFAVTIAASVLAEAVCLRLMGRPAVPALKDGSAVLAGWLLALTLPPWAPWWIGVLGALFAIVIGKQVFGGLGQNLFNPAMVARVALLVSFPLQMTQWVLPAPLGAAAAPGFLEGLAVTFGGAAEIDAVSAATALGHVKTEIGRGLPFAEAFAGFAGDRTALALGGVPGSLGETSALLLLAGGLVLVVRKVISWRIPLAMLATLGGLASLFHLLDPAAHAGPAVHLLGGAAILGAFFIATDLVTSPVTARGQVIFGVGVGVFTYVIRSWAGYPEGLGFAVLLMNAAVPLIDRWTRPRVYGRTRDGRPLDGGGAR